MPHKPAKNKLVGRPEKEIRHTQFEAIMSVPFVTLPTVAMILEVSESTVKRFCIRNYGKTFDLIKAERFEGIKVKLMAKQYEVAMNGSVAMLTFLGKNYLGQSDKMEFSGNSEKPLVLSYSKEALKQFIEGQKK